MEHILHATDLVMDYSTQQATPNATHMLALNHVDFGIQAGESIAVMGPSGSGKSTLLHALAGIITPTAGNVMFRGANLARLSDADRTKLRRSAFGFVFQSGQLLPELPAIENIALPMMLGRRKLPAGHRHGHAMAGTIGTAPARATTSRRNERRPDAAHRHRTCARRAAGSHLRR